MRRAQLTLIGMLLFAVSAQGSVLEDIAAVDLDGAAFETQSVAGKAVLVDFWGTWCAPCIHAFPKLKQLHEDFDEQLAVIGVAFYSGEPEDISKFAQEHELTYRLLLGEESMLESFEVIAFPSYFLLSAEGEIIFQIYGNSNNLYERVAEYLGDVLSTSPE